MKGQWKVLLVFAACLAIILVLCGTAAADGQTNPRRQHVEELLRWKDSEPEYYRSDDDSVYITLSCKKAPTLAAPGKFTVTINNDDGSDWYLEYGVSDYGRDRTGFVFLSSITSSLTFDDFVFYTAGEYRIMAFLFEKADGRYTQRGFASMFITVDEDPDYPTIEEKAQSIVKQCRVSGDDWQTALNLHDWLTHNLYYDLNYEYYGADAIFRGKGVCDSYSKAYKLLCTTAGITIDRVTSDAQNHAWNAIKLEGDWYQVDVTWDDPATGTKPVSGYEGYDYFCLSDQMMFLDHTHYDVSFDPGCNTMKLNYYVKTDQWQQYGKYKSSGSTVIGYFQDKLEQGETEITFYLSDWKYYYSSGGYGYSMSKLKYGIYTGGLEQTAWKLKDGTKVSVEIILNLDDQYLMMKVMQAMANALNLPEKTKTISEYAFEGVSATIVVIPEGCTTIKAGAFRNSGVLTVYAPSTLVNIADDAFDGCAQIHFKLNGQTNEALTEYAEAHGHIVD